MTQGGAISRAQSAYGDGDYAKCLYHLDRAETYGPYSDVASARLSFQRGLCLEASGRKAEANAVYQNVARKYPDSDWASQARARSQS